MSEMSVRIARAVKLGVIARAKYFKAIDLPDEQALGGPADPAIIMLIESRMDRVLPTSYREFLLLFDGWHMIDGGVNLFSAVDMVSGGIYQAVANWQARAAEQGDAVASRSLVIGESMITPTKYLLDPTVTDETGEWQFVQYHNGVEAKVQSFLIWLEQSVDEYLELANNPFE